MSTNSSPEFERIPIVDYRWKYLLYAIVCWSLVLAGFLAIKAKERAWEFWMAEVVMLCFGTGLFYMLFSGRYVFIGRKGADFDAYMQKKYADLLNDTGDFTYTDDGFVFNGDGKQIEIKYSEINRISGHLEDMVSNDDDLVLRIEYGNNHFFEIDEELRGWLFLRQQLREHFHYDQSWQDVLLKSKLKEIEIWKRAD